MYYVQKAGDGYYLSPVSDGALFSIDEFPERPCGKAGHMVVLAVDEEQQTVWYEYRKIEVETATDKRLTALEENKADREDLDVIARAIERGFAL